MRPPVIFIVILSAGRPRTHTQGFLYGDNFNSHDYTDNPRPPYSWSDLIILPSIPAWIARNQGARQSHSDLQSQGRADSQGLQGQKQEIQVSQNFFFFFFPFRGLEKLTLFSSIPGISNLTWRMTSIVACSVYIHPAKVTIQRMFTA